MCKDVATAVLISDRLHMGPSYILNYAPRRLSLSLSSLLKPQHRVGQMIGLQHQQHEWGRAVTIYYTQQGKLPSSCKLRKNVSDRPHKDLFPWSVWLLTEYSNAQALRGESSSFSRLFSLSSLPPDNLVPPPFSYLYFDWIACTIQPII